MVCLFVFFMDQAFDVVSQKSLLNSRSQGFFHMFSFRGFVAVGFIFRSIDLRRKIKRLQIKSLSFFMSEIAFMPTVFESYFCWTQNSGLTIVLFVFFQYYKDVVSFPFSLKHFI